MFTSIDKALVALFMAALYLFTAFTGIPTDWLRSVAEPVIVGLTPVLIYLIPNKPAAS